MSCRVCDAQVADSLCPACADKLGLARGPSARPALPCARCSHPQVIRALVRELTATPGQFGGQIATPMGVTYQPAFRGIADSLKGVEEKEPFGILEMHVCRKCGFTEWYCRDPLKIPIGAEYGTELVDAPKTGGGNGPYR